MSITASIHVEGSIIQEPTRNLFIFGSTWPNITKKINTVPSTNSNGVISFFKIKLANGNNTITIPTGSRGVVITSGALSTPTKILKGVAGDTGIPVLPPLVKRSMLLLFSSVQTSFVISSQFLDIDFTEFVFF